MRESGPQKAENDDRSALEKDLASGGWLADCTPGLRQDLLDLGTTTRFRRGETLFRVGDAPEGIYGVARGAVHIAMPADDGQELVIYHTGTGFWVGDLELLSDRPRIATVVAAETTLCLFISRSKLIGLLENEPSFYRDFFRMSYENGRTIMRALANMTVAGSDKRLALRLLQYDEDSCDADGWIAIAQNQLAMTTALSLPTLERLLRRFEAAGLVEIGYRKHRILDRAGLLNLSQSE